jgi:hypothetical protein
MIPGTAPAAPKRTAKEMLGLLDAHYAPPPSKPPGGRLLTEIQAPHSTRRADALYMPITTHGRGTIVGHEVKVSRADVIQELRDPHKADSWLQFCTRWWLVVSDPAFIEGLDVPDSWGVMAPPTKGRFMTIVQKAPTLTPPVMARMHEAWGTIFARVAYADIAVEREAAWNAKRAATMETSLHEAEAEVRRLTSIVDGNAAGLRARVTVAEVIAACERLGGYGKDSIDGLDGTAWKVNAERVAVGILAHIKQEDPHRDFLDDLATARARAERAVEQMRALEEALAGPPLPDVGSPS